MYGFVADVNVNLVRESHQCSVCVHASALVFHPTDRCLPVPSPTDNKKFAKYLSRKKSLSLRLTVKLHIISFPLPSSHLLSSRVLCTREGEERGDD